MSIVRPDFRSPRLRPSAANHRASECRCFGLALLIFSSNPFVTNFCVASGMCMRHLRRILVSIGALTACGCGAGAGDEAPEQHASVEEPTFFDPAGCTREYPGRGFDNGFFQQVPDVFTVEYFMIPESNWIDAVIGLSNGPADSFKDLAAIVRMAPSGMVDVRNGSAYTADANFQYFANQQINVKMNVNLLSHTYDV